MKLLINKSRICIVLLTLLSITSNAQINPCFTSAEFLLINPDAQSSSMGLTGITNSNFANSIFNNVSLSAFQEDHASTSVSYMPTAFSGNGNLLSIAGMSTIGSKQSFGFSAKYIKFTEINFTDINGNPTGRGRPYDYELSAAYARLITPHLSFGVRPKIIISNIGTGQLIDGIPIRTATSVAVDLSLSYKKTLNDIGDQIIVGATFSNLGTDLTYFEGALGATVPRYFGLGLSYIKYINQDFSLIASAEYRNAIKNPVLINRFSFGTQLNFKQNYRANLGYSRDESSFSTNGLITAGLGISFKKFAIDLSYQKYLNNNQNIPLGEGLRISLSIKFN